MRGAKGTRTPHGNVSTYSNHGCRCEACTRAWADWRRDYTHRAGLHLPRYVYTARAAVEAMIRDNHGTETRYSGGCRCAECREASAAARRRRRRNRLAETRAYERARWHRRQGRA